MNRLEFLSEVKNSNRCPDSFEAVYSQFQVYQQVTLDTLLEVHRVCESNNVCYELAYGSLIGLVRDGGLVPWDYDIDIIVPYEQKQKLIDALNRDLKAGFYYYSPDNNEKCRHMKMRIAPVEYRTEAIHVDVWFFIGTPEEKDERASYVKRIARLSRLRFGKLVNLREESVGSPKEYLMLLCRSKLPSLFVSLRSIDEEYRRMCAMYSSSEATYCVPADTYAAWKEIPSKLLWDTEVVRCDYGEVRIPRHYDEILTILYGDYHTVPPLDDRIEEVMSNFERIVWFSKNQGKGSVVDKLT